MVGRIFLGRYEAIRLLGEGGMGRVYLARQVDLGRQVVVKVMDFGLAKLFDSNTLKQAKKVTDTGADFAVGTPGYISPEQVRGEEMDHRSDLYSVGVILYELLTGKLPFSREETMDVLLAHATEEPPSFEAVGARGTVSAAVEHVVSRCLAKCPD